MPAINLLAGATSMVKTLTATMLSIHAWAKAVAPDAQLRQRSPLPSYTPRA